MYEMKIFACHNPSLSDRLNSSSGGVFAYIAKQILERGGVVYGASFDSQWNVSHRRITSKKDLHYIMGSKYVNSNISNAVNEAIRDLQNGELVLFSGTPCQVAVLKHRVGDNNNLLLVEVICHGVPETRSWNEYITEQCNDLGYSLRDVESINFRDKRTGWKDYSFTIKFNNGFVFTQSHRDNLYMKAFLDSLTLKRACFNCKYKLPKDSRADITLGDAWGIDIIKPNVDSSHGVSLVIPHSDCGVRMISSLIPDAELKLEEVILYNPALIHCAGFPKRYTNFQLSKMSMLKKLKKYTTPTFCEKAFNWVNYHFGLNI